MKPVPVEEVNCCHAYCIAALLEIPFYQVPDCFKGSQNGTLWDHHKQIKWLKKQGYASICLMWPKMEIEGVGPIINGVYCIMGGKTPHGTLHAVICQTNNHVDDKGRDVVLYELVYDCNQYTKDLVWPFIDKGIDSVDFLIPLTDKVYSGRIS